MQFSRTSFALVPLAALVTFGVQPAAWAQGAGGPSAAMNISIAAQPLAQALTELARQTRTTLVASPALLAGKRSPAVAGQLTARQALDRLLADSGLVGSIDGSAVTVREAPATAVAGVPQPPTLAAITVTATADPKEKAYETPAAVSVITREEMDRIQARHISDILQATPGVFTTTNEQVPSVSVDVRGLKDFGRVTMSIDGMRQDYQRSGHQQRNGEMFFDPEFLSDIEVDKGPASGVGGLGATGGVANFRTIEAADVLLPGKSVGLRLRGNTGLSHWRNGSDPSGSAAFAIQARDDLDLLIATSARRAGEYKPGNRGDAFNLFGQGFQLPLNTVSLTDQDQDSLLFKVRWRPLAGHELKFTALRTKVNFSESATQNLDDAYNQFIYCADPESRQTTYCQTIGNTAYDPNAVYPKNSSSWVKSTSLGLDYAWKPAGNPWIDLSAKLYYVSTDNRTVSTRDTQSTFVTRTDTLGLWAVNRALVPLGADWLLDWRLGAEAYKDRNRPSAESTQYSSEQIDAINGSTPRGNRLLAGAFTQFSFQYHDWLELTPGLRYEYARLWGHTGFTAADLVNGGWLRQYSNIDVDRRWGRWLPSLNIAVKPAEPVQLFVNAAKGWRPPAITEALIAGDTPGHLLPVKYYPNYLLEPEKTTSLEIGANLRWDNLLAPGDRLRMKASAFRSKTDNYVFFTNNIGLPGGSWGLLNNMFVASTDPVTFKGFELDANYDGGGWFAGLGVARLERDATFMHLSYPLSPTLVQRPGNTSTSAYIPALPKYTGHVTGGLRLMERRLELSTTVRCASKGSHASGDNGNDRDIQNVQQAFCAWDAQAVYRPSERVSVGLTVRNIRDRQYAQAGADALVRTYAPGRTVVVFTELRF